MPLIFMFFLIVKISVVKTNCENIREAKAYELVSLSHKNFAESKESFTTFLYTYPQYRCFII